MRLPSLFLALALAGTVTAQCDHSPTITPVGLILCPFTTAELTTQQYDSYQWYKQGVPIPGATQQTLAVNFQADAGYRFRVEGTLNGCTAISEQVLVDGWAFPTLMATSGGDAPHTIENGGILRYCLGDTATLTLNAPYTANITWFRDGVAMPVVDDPTLMVTGSGSYTAWAAPGQCPDLVFSLDVSITLLFDDVPVPVIQNIGGVLCASPFSNDYGWYLNGGTEPIDIGTCHEPQVPGAYTARRITTEECTAPSAPYLHVITGQASLDADDAFAVHLRPGDLLQVERPAHAVDITHWRITDLQGRTLHTGRFPLTEQLQVPLADLAAGIFLFQPLRDDGGAAMATRFVLAR
ncbi:MAG TPA: hypothetical protein PLB89_13950 [Flavobacteriales bacterium]|nr:hypothetical protein [Flavobacteriales bacterium]